MMLLMLGLIDVVIGTALAAHDSIGSGIVLVLGLLALLKGLWSVISGIAAGFWTDVLGFLDIVAGISLLMGWAVPLLWIFVIAKGAWSMISGVLVK